MRSILSLLGTFLVSTAVLVAGDADVTHYLLVSNRQGRDILRYNRDTGDLVDTLVAAGTAGMGVPYGMDIGPDGHLYVTSVTTEQAQDARVLRFNLHTGAFLGVVADLRPDLQNPYGLEFGPDQKMYVADRHADGSGRVPRYDGPTATYLGDFTQGSSDLAVPTGLTFGPDGVLYVANLWGGIARFNGTTGEALGILPTPGIGSTQFVQFGPDGLLYVTDYFASRTVAYNVSTGLMERDLSGGTSGMRFDSDGSLFVADFWSNRILHFQGDVSTVFAAGNPLQTFMDSGALSGPVDLVLYSVPEPCAAPLVLGMVAATVWILRRRSRTS